MACSRTARRTPFVTAACVAALLGLADARRSQTETSDLDMLQEVMAAHTSQAGGVSANRSRHFLHEVGAKSFGETAGSGVRQAQKPMTVTNTGLAEEMGNAVVATILGFVMVIFSIPVLFINERQNARMETLLDRAAAQFRTVAGEAASKDNRGRLVYLQNEMLVPAEAVADHRFDVTLETGCVRLTSNVEVYQWVEHQQREQRNKLGGGKETITTYRYAQEWASSCIDSSRFQDRRHQNTNPDGLVFGSETRECGRVELGGGFLLPAALVGQCSDFKCAAERLDNTVALRSGGGSRFLRGPAGMFYHRVGDDRWAGEGAPETGDARVTFRCVAAGPVSVMALQGAGPEGEERDSFLPYRLISRGLFGMKEEDEKMALTAEGQKSMLQLADEDGCGSGLFAVFCCAFACVARMCSMMAPEVQHLFAGDVEASDCLQRIAATRGLAKWLIRLVGWLMMFMGLFAIFSPLITLLNVIPFIGSLGSATIWVFCLFATVVTATFVISFAYLIYNPFKALLTAVVALKIAALPVGIAVLLGWRPWEGGI